MFKRNVGYLFYKSIKEDYNDWKLVDNAWLENDKIDVSIEVTDGKLYGKYLKNFVGKYSNSKEIISPEFNFLERFFMKKSIKLYFKIKKKEYIESNNKQRADIFLRLTKMKIL